MTAFAIEIMPHSVMTNWITPEVYGSDEGRIVETRFVEIRENWAGSPALTHRNEVVAALVRSRAEEWREATKFYSSMTQITGHPAYREVVALGSDVVPILLRELRQRPEPWFAALRELTGENPVKPEQRGDMRAMADAWVSWGRARGLIV